MSRGLSTRSPGIHCIKSSRRQAHMNSIREIGNATHSGGGGGGYDLVWLAFRLAYILSVYTTMGRVIGRAAEPGVKRRFNNNLDRGAGIDQP